MTLTDKTLTVILTVTAFYLASMINTESWIPRPDTLVDCHVGERTFTLEKQDCKTDYTLIK